MVSQPPRGPVPGSRPRTAWIRRLATPVVLALVVAACASPASPPPSTGASAAPTTAASPTPSGPLVLKVAATANVTTWDPVKSFSTEALYMANIYEPLLWINPPGSAETYTPALATSWEPSADGLTWTFKLREGVTFHDGTAMDATAVVRSIEAARERGGASFIWAPLDTITATDPSTVTMTLKWAAPMDLVASSLYGAWIVSPKALDAVAADETYFESGVDGGTGPYTIESFTPDEEILLTRYDDYWGGWSDVTHYDKVLVSITPEASTQEAMLDGGDVDLALSIPLETIKKYETDDRFTYSVEPSFFNYVGLFNTTRKPLDDPKVRQALSYAVPYDDVIALGALGFGTQSRGPVPEGVFPWSADVPQYTYDEAKARALLAETDVADGDFSIEITYASENQNEARFAPVLKDAWEKLGIEVTLTPMLFNQQWERAKGDPAQAQDVFLVLYWPTYSDAGSDNLWSLFHSSESPFFNLSYWKDAEYDGLVDGAGAKTATDRVAAQADYVTAMQRLVDQAPGLFFYDTKVPLVIPKSIEGFQYNLNYPFAQFFYPLHPAG